MHPRDWAHPGRIKVELFDELGQPKLSEFSTSKNLEVKLIYREITLCKDV
jgi:hypothetical protein